MNSIEKIYILGKQDLIGFFFRVVVHFDDRNNFDKRVKESSVQPRFGS